LKKFFYPKNQPDEYLNYQFSTNKSYLLKTLNISLEDIKLFLNTMYKNPYDIGKNSTQIEWKETTIPSFYPFILIWLLYNPSLKKYTNKIKGEIIILPIKDNMIYYKLPNHKLLLK
jgi:hypothetical protein